jgi:RNA polymerase sigma-70 factor, ECF subfamily
MFFKDASRRWRTRVSFGEPIALRGQELEQVAAATSNEVRASGEAQFIERLRAGEAAAFDRLVQERSGDVYALLYRMTEDAEEARDLTQETFLRIFQSIERFRGDADLKTWIYRIAINQARNRWRWWRRRRRDVTVSLDAEGTRDDEQPLSARLRDAGNDPEEEALLRERELALRTALRSLGRSYREVVILRDVEGLSYEEVAATLEISIGTVKSRLSRGRQELRRRIGSSL